MILPEYIVFRNKWNNHLNDKLPLHQKMYRKGNKFKVGKNYILSAEIGWDDYNYFVLTDSADNTIYTSPFCEDYEKLFDELIIFVELIMPRYL